ncbi:MAG TPA: hypothetical protein VN456_11425 [Desulfosporosinus sp.]|nr:hypothetical protein [Desulfosporosinus sp.]
MATMIRESRKNDLIHFYQLFRILEQKTGGPFYLFNGNPSSLPRRGVYFFMEHGELRTDTGTGFRIVRVGTHGLTNGSSATLGQRLTQHKGIIKSGGGNHRGSIFRKLVGSSLLDSHFGCSEWGQGTSANADIRLNEEPLEKEVSSIIRNMPFLYLNVDDAASPDSLRGIVERNSIALLSNYKKPPLDLPSPLWMGYQCNRERVRLSGLWNQNHVDEAYDPLFLNTFELLINKTGCSL